MNGDKQEGAYDFIQKPLPEIGAGELFEPYFNARRTVGSVEKRCQPPLQGQSCFLQFPETWRELRIRWSLNMSSANV